MHHQSNGSHLRSTHASMSHVQGNAAQASAASGMNGYNVPNQPASDGVLNMLFSQMNSMPNFFFDNNLGI